jgi:hypothetical protein
VRWRATLAAAAVLAGCGDAPAAEDVPRYDARDAVVEETPDAAASDVPGRFDVIPSIDVIALGDTAAASDAGAADDASACQAVSEDYAAAVRDAQSCRVDGECDAPVCETLCCACQVFVSTTAAGFARLDLLRERWATLGCATMGRCAGGGGACGAAVSVSCSAEGRCVTVRERGDGGGSDAAEAADAARPGLVDAGLDAAAR